MRSRGLVVAIAVVLAVAAAAAVILYTQGVKKDAEDGGALQTVIVSSIEIRANEALNPLVAQDVFKQIRVPQDALVAGAVTDIRQLEDATTTSTVLANEQIPISRLSSGPRPNELGISEGHIAVAVELEAPQGGTGNVQPGDNISVFATYQNVQAVPGNIRQAVNNPAAVNAGRKVDLPDFTVTLDPDREGPEDPEPRGRLRDRSAERQRPDPDHPRSPSAGRAEPRVRAGERADLARSPAAR